MAALTSSRSGGAASLKNWGRVGTKGKTDASQGSGSGLLKTLEKCFAKTSAFSLSVFALPPSCFVILTEQFAV
eukprot:998925-Ditylum_brightwellii.AAC.1